VQPEEIEKIVEEAVGSRLLHIQEQLDRIIELLERIAREMPS